MTTYKLFIRKYDIRVNDYVVVERIIKTDDLYHEIGKIYCQSIEDIKRIDYKELKTNKDEKISDLELVLEKYRNAKLLANKYYHEMCSLLNNILSDKEIEILIDDLFGHRIIPFTTPSPLTEFENQEGEGVTVEEFLENMKLLKEKLKENKKEEEMKK